MSTRHVFGSILTAVLALGLWGCEECWNEPCCSGGWHDDQEAPLPPVGVSSVTGDARVELDWLSNQEDDLSEYRVYVSNSPQGPYDLIGETAATRFTDHHLDNGRTYYYAVTSVDYCGNESDLSRDLVHDTPRPEGQVELFDAAGPHGSESGFDFAAFRRQAFNAPGTDIYMETDRGVPCILTAGPSVGLQDIGYLALEDLDWAPDGGWSPTGRVEVIPGHTYALVTPDRHFAKFEVLSLRSGSVIVAWAYQIDRGNRELSVDPPPVAKSAPESSGSESGGSAIAAALDGR